MGFHHWRKFEDEVICSHVLAGKTDDKTIQAIAKLLGISPAKVAFRMTNFIKQKNGCSADWHCSKQERRVFDMMKYI